MSGGLLTPVTPSDPLPDPRTCYICREKYQDARMLQCCHTFCAKCLQERVMDTALLCPLCGSLTKLEGPQQLPPVDPVVKFLVETVHEDKPYCANCDQWADAMFYCNTCAQPLCGECRQATHSAKMFQAHQIGPMMPRSRETFKTCYMHGEPFILFSVETKAMLCINCFRDLDVESRPYCIDLDTAYSQSCQILDQSANTVKEVQRSVNDGILLLKSILQELKQNAEQERVAILTLYSDITEKIAAKRDDLLQDVERQSDSKQRQFTEHLRQLSCLLPTVQTQLQMTSEFSSTANKFEFLELAYRLIDRINQTLHNSPEPKPSSDGEIQTNHRSQFARSLDSLLSLKPVNRFGDHSPSLSPASMHSHPDYRRGDTVESTLPSPSTTSTITFTSDGGRKINGSSGVNKVIMIESKGIFANHFKGLENRHREVVQRFESVKGCVQELQRDMTMRRCLAKTAKVTELLNNTSTMEEHITKHLEAAEKQRPLLEKHWEDIFHQVSDEQEVYQAQVNDILRMRQEAQHLNTIIKKLAPFVKSINNVTEHLSPRLGEMTRENEKGDQIQALFERISTLDPDSQLRVDAIRSTEEERQLLSANRVNPLDAELINTKGKLKSPSVRIEREQARLAKEKQGKGDDASCRSRTVSECSIQDGHHDSVCSESECSEVGANSEPSTSVVDDRDSSLSRTVEDFTDEKDCSISNQIMPESTSLSVEEKDSETSKKSMNGLESQTDILQNSTSSDFDDLKEMSPSFVVSTNSSKTCSKSEGAKDLKLLIPKEFVRDNQQDHETSSNACSKSDLKPENDATKEKSEGTLRSVRVNKRNSIHGDDLKDSSLAETSFEQGELDAIVLHNADVPESVSSINGSQEKRDSMTSTIKDCCVCKEGVNKEGEKTKEKRTKIDKSLSIVSIESDKCEQIETKDISQELSKSGDGVVSNSVSNPELNSDVSDLQDISGSFERFMDANGREMTPTSQQVSIRSTSAVHKRKNRMKELRKCNSLGRGKDEKCESKPPTGRKFSFDLGGVTPNDLNLRSLLHDAIIARGEQHNSQKKDIAPE